MMDTHELLYELSFYLIRPNTELLAMLAQYPDDLLSLSYPRLWANSDESITSLHDDDHLALVKLIFLAKLSTNVDYNTDPNAKALGSNLLGMPPYRVETFDRW